MNTIDKIKAEIERRITDNTFGAKLELIDILAWLDTLESEKTVPADLDFEQELYNRFGQIKDFTLGMRIGQYFYELGCRRTTEKFDEIEYNRQRAEECVPNDLEEAAGKSSTQYYQDAGYSPFPNVETAAHKSGFIAGAKWQAEQLLKSSPLAEDTVLFNKGVEEGRRLAEEEQADLLTIAHLQGADQMKELMMNDGNVILAEEDFEAEKEKSMEWGYNLCKEQMMKEAVEGEIQMQYSGSLCAKTIRAINEDKFKFGDKVKIIIVKEEEK